MSQIGIRLNLKITPGASKNEVLGLADGLWRLKIAAPPDKGKANKELVDFLSKILNIKKDDIAILRGHTARNKLVSVSGLTEPEIIRLLSKA